MVRLVPAAAAALIVVPAIARAQETLFTVGQTVEMRAGGGWRKCVVIEAGDEAAYHPTRVECEAFPTPGYTYPAGMDSFSAKGSSDVRFPGSCTTTSPYANLRAIPGCRSAAAIAAPTRPTPTRPGPVARTAAPPEQAAPGPKLERCTPGMRVLTPGGLSATGVSAQGAGCTIRTDVGNRSIDGTFAAFMLRPIGKAPPGTATPNGAGRLPTGEYGCIGARTTQLAGLGSKLLPGGVYTDLEGRERGSYRIVGNTVRFTGGHLDGQVGQDIKDNGFRIGMVSCQKW